MDDYKNHPPTIGEIRSDRSGLAIDWSIRDMLVALLRDIDNGHGDIATASHVIMVAGHIGDGGSTRVTLYRAGTKTAWESLGMLAEAQSVITSRG